MIEKVILVTITWPNWKRILSHIKSAQKWLEYRLSFNEEEHEKKIVFRRPRTY